MARLQAQPDGGGGSRHHHPAAAGGCPRACHRALRPDRTGARQAAPAAIGDQLVRHRRARPRHLQPHRLRHADHAGHRAAGRRHGRPLRPADRCDFRLLRRLGRPPADAHHRRVPGLPAPRAGAGLRRGARPRHRQRDHRHRDHDLASLRPRRPRRDHGDPQPGLHRRHAPAGRLAGAHHLEACRADVHVVADRAHHLRHGRHHPDGRRPRLPWPRRPAAHAGMGRDDLGRPRADLRPVVGRDLPRHCHLHRRARLQPARRRAPRRHGCEVRR